MIDSIYRLRRKALKNRMGEVLDTVGLDDDKTFIESYSTGMKKRLMLARAILYDPQIFLLDEPYSGLDPEGCKLLCAIINEEGKREKRLFSFPIRLSIFHRIGIILKWKRNIYVRVSKLVRAMRL